MRLPGTFFLRNLVKNRSLVYQLVRRDFEQRYVGSAVGWLWGVVHPLVLLRSTRLSSAYAFGMRLPRGEVTDSYPLSSRGNAAVAAVSETLAAVGVFAGGVRESDQEDGFPG